MRQISYTKAALRTLARLPPGAAALVLRKIEQLAEEPGSLANKLTALKGSDLSRLRVGDYRVIFTIDLEVLAVLKLGHRRDIYD